MRNIDLKKLREIPILEVCNRYGIQLKKRGNNYIGKIRDEKTGSFVVNVEKNIWSDFGQAKTNQSTIDLVCEIEKLEVGNAIKKLSYMFNIKDKNKDNEGFKYISDSEYKKIGIDPTLATKNNLINLDRMSINEAYIISEKYNMTMQELAKKYPKVHDRIIYENSLDLVKKEREHTLKVAMFARQEENKGAKEFLEDLALIKAGDVNSKIKIIEKVLCNKDVDLKRLYINKNMILDKKVIHNKDKDFINDIKKWKQCHKEREYDR